LAILALPEIIPKMSSQLVAVRCGNLSENKWNVVEERIYVRWKRVPGW
jgi:hypothetical protein